MALLTALGISDASAQSADPCQGPVQNVAIGTAGATNVQVVAPGVGRRVFICSLSLIVGAATVVNVIEGTGSACITANSAAIIGSTTAANGMSLATNGGLTYGNGKGTVGATATPGNGVCVLTSGSVQFGGNMTFVQQ